MSICQNMNSLDFSDIIQQISLDYNLMRSSILTLFPVVLANKLRSQLQMKSKAISCGMWRNQLEHLFLSASQCDCKRHFTINLSSAVGKSLLSKDKSLATVTTICTGLYTKTVKADPRPWHKILLLSQEANYWKNIRRKRTLIEKRKSKF